MTTATLTYDADNNATVTDEYGDAWTVIADDGCGRKAVERDAGERWEAAELSEGDLAICREGDTFGVTHAGQYVVRRADNAGSLKWVET